jgi:hypothetical protein
VFASVKKISQKQVGRFFNNYNKTVFTLIISFATGLKVKRSVTQKSNRMFLDFASVLLLLDRGNMRD